MLQDLRYALRHLVRNPLFAAVALVTLALGIGATTAIFSVVDHLILRDPPFPNADRVVTVWQDNRRENNPREDVAPGNYLEWKDRSGVFAALGSAEPYSMDLTGDGLRPQVIFSSLVTEGFFDALGVRPVRGRLFEPTDFRQGAGKVAVVGHGLWRRQFGGDTAIVGRSLLLDGEPHVVVGILPADFDLGLMYSVRERELWVPRLLQGWERGARSSAWWAVVGRLKPGVSLAQAQADMDRVAANLEVEYPATNEGIGITLVPLHEHLVGAARPALLTLLGAVGLVLLIACANVAHLQLARGTERVGEFAVRAALGSERSRLVRQLLTESVVLALVGTVGGLLLAYWGVDVVKVLSPGTVPRIDAVTVDARILGFAIVFAVMSAVLFGLAPALQFSNPRLHEVLKEGRTSGGRTRARLRGGLIVAETALALTLLIGAGLLLRSFVALLAVDPGFRTENVLALQVFYYEEGHTAQDRIQFFRESLERIETLPGVRSAGAVSAAPFLAANIDIRTMFTAVGEPTPREGEEPQAYLSHATPRYFETLGIPVLRGRVFSEFDRVDAPPVALINETLRLRYWPAEAPIGKKLLIGESKRVVEVVGVVGDVRHTGLDTDPRPEVFLPHAQTGTGSMTYFLRTVGDPATLLDAAQRVVWDLAPLQTFYQTGTVKQLVSTSLASRRFTMILLNAFAAIALVMAAVGIYGVMSFSVTQRTHDGAGC
jgi:putative ABC transport system permease protein